MNVENHNLAVRIFDALNKRGARLENAAVGLSSASSMQANLTRS